MTNMEYDKTDSISIYRDMIDKKQMEYRMAFQAEDQRIIDESGHSSYEMPMMFSDGVMHETLYSVSGFKKADGSPGGLVGIFIDIAEIREAERALDTAKTEIEEHHKIILNSLNYSSKIQKNMLPSHDKFVKVFADYSIIWEPRDVVGGDIYWLKTYNEGTVLCVADCTGHGTSGALLTMLVASTLEAEVKPDNCRDTAEIKFYIASDGLFDQPGSINSLPFGYKMFEKIILDNHDRQQQDISDEIWSAFEAYRGDEPRVI